MSGIEGNSPAGGPLNTGAGAEGSASAQRREVSADEADQFAKSLSNNSGQKTGGAAKPAAGSGQQAGLPQPQSGAPNNAQHQPKPPADAAQSQQGSAPAAAAGQPKPAASTGQPQQGSAPAAAASQSNPAAGAAQPQSGTAQATAGGPKPETAAGLYQPGGATAAQGQSNVEAGLPRPQSASQTVAADADPPQSIAAAAATPAAAQPNGAVSVDGTAAPAAPRESVSDLAEKLASRILASKPESGSSEVRIELSMNKLQGAVITMRQDANGLSVVFDSPSPEVTGRLMETRGDLVQRLQSATGENVTVEVNESEPDQDGQPGDGRSRNRHDQESDDGEPDDA